METYVDRVNRQGKPKVVFRKNLSPAQAEAEAGGWREISANFAVPALFGKECLADSQSLIYEDVFANGRCQLLLGDVIAIADRDPGAVPRVVDLIDGICHDLCRATEQTGRMAQMADCVPNLYLDRIRPGGRIDAWYVRKCPTIAISGAPVLPLGDLSGYRMIVNGAALRLDLNRLISDVRATLTPGSSWMTALTQGDPTEPNIAEPLCWLDFECAGRNTLVGEVANLLWYLLTLGGWLVPRYQPEVYARTLRLGLAPHPTPRLDHIEMSWRHRHLEVHYSWLVGVGRHAAIVRLLDWIRSDLAGAIGRHPDDLMIQLRAFLAMRILGVIPAGQLAPPDMVILLAKLAECQGMRSSVESFAHSTTQSPAQTAEEPSLANSQS